MRKLIILLGLPNAGKGYLTELLRDIFKKNGDTVTVIPMSTLLRKEVPESEERMNLGELVPDDIVIPVAIRALTEAEGNILILDGFPRTVKQVEELRKVIKDKDIAILELNTPKSVAIERAKNRLACSNCGSTCTKTGKFAPAVPGKCDKCGGKLICRKDDELIEKRIQMHEENMIPAASMLQLHGISRVNVDYKKLDEKHVCECLDLLFSK